MSEFGKRPELRWIDVDLLDVDHAYQRTLEGRASQRLVAKIAANWQWRYAGVLVVAPAPENRWLIIDGQHRHAAAKSTGKIRDLPCLIIDADSTADQAKAFVHLNRDRVGLSYMSVFHAALAAGEGEQVEIDRACREADVALLSYPKQSTIIRPNETMALGTIQSLYRGRIVAAAGRQTVIDVLRVIREAYPELSAQLGASMITTVAKALASQVGRDIILKALAGTTSQQLEAEARALVSQAPGTTLSAAWFRVLAKRINIAANSAMLDEMNAPAPPKPERPVAAALAPRRSSSKPKHEPKARPFTFKRAAAAEPVKAKPVDFRGDVPVRKFESGTFAEIAMRTIEKAGKGRYESYMRKTTQMYKCGDKVITTNELIAMADKIRVKLGLQPLASMKGAA